MSATTATRVVPAAPSGFFGQLASFPRAFWMANSMEGIERWAYYGVRTVVTLYIVDALAHGGLNFTYGQSAVILAVWAIVQSFLPLFTGGYADRYGYKKTLAVSIAIKIAGYLLMGTQHSFLGFLTGCVVLATGTAVFKPGVQGIVANTTTRSNASVGWGLFYMLVNIGGALGPFTAHAMRGISWQAVFLANAALVSLNFLMLLSFKEPSSGLEPADAPNPASEFLMVVVRAVRDILTNGRLLAFIALNTGFWLMFNQLFDLLTNFIDDWVDTTHLQAAALAMHVPTWIVGMPGHGIAPEQMINIDAAAIVLFMVPVAYLVRRWVTMTTMVVGVVISVVGLLMAGQTQLGGWCALGIFVFAVGEMLASPMLQKYMSEIAPQGQMGLFMGYSQIPVGIGWALGDLLGDNLYQKFGDKVTLARQYLVEQLHQNATAVAAIPREKVVPMLAAQLHTSEHGVATLLFGLHHPERVWYVISSFGLISVIGMAAFGAYVKAADRKALEGVASAPGV